MIETPQPKIIFFSINGFLFLNVSQVTNKRDNLLHNIFDVLNENTHNNKIPIAISVAKKQILGEKDECSVCIIKIS